MRSSPTAVHVLAWRAALALPLLGCTAQQPNKAALDAPAAQGQASDAAVSADAGAAVHDGRGAERLDTAPPAELSDCAEHARTAGLAYPQTVVEAVEFINALPKPTSLPCLLASLPRPLSLVATSNVTSAQPADGRDSPRIFLLTDALTLSVVPSGDGRVLLEFGEYVTVDRSLKAEVEFPVDQALGAQSPFSRVKYSDEITACGFCHREEMPHGSIPDAFVSLAFRTFPDTEVPIAEVREQYERCDSGEDAYRCQMLQGLFAFGEVRQGAFPAELPLFH